MYFIFYINYLKVFTKLINSYTNKNRALTAKNYQDKCQV